jgi:hypothetical protein
MFFDGWAQAFACPCAGCFAAADRVEGVPLPRLQEAVLFVAATGSWVGGLIGGMGLKLTVAGRIE